MAFSNMASPITRGSIGASPFTSKYVDILEESILIILNKELGGAKYIVEYRINSSLEGVQIPLLFYAFDYKNDFKIWIDGKEVELKPLPVEFQKVDGVLFNNFNYLYKDTLNNTIDAFTQETLGGDFYVSLSDLIYFETNIGKGEHLIKVEYNAQEWINGSDWVNEYSLRYALSPAKFWKSYGKLKITLDAKGCKYKISTNLGNPTSGSLDSIAIWNFNKLPADIISIDYNPEISVFAKALIDAGPGGLGLVFFVILIILHVLYIISYRRKSIEKRFSWVMITGSFLVPALAIISFILFYPMIDALIGQHASERHGYYFLIILVYPFVAPVYLLIMWLTDRFYKRYLVRMNEII